MIGDYELSGVHLLYKKTDQVQLIAEGENTAAFPETDLTNGQMYCNKLNSHDADCKSDFSDILRATFPNQI